MSQGNNHKHSLDFLRKQTVIPWRSALRTTIVCAILLSCIDLSKVGHFFTEEFVRTIEFRTRDFFGNSPKLDPRIKLVLMDNKTIAERKSSELTLEEWGKVIRKLEVNKPSVILFDHLLSWPKGLDEGEDKKFIQLVRGSQTKVYAGSFYRRNAVEKLPVLDWKREGFSKSFPATDISWLQKRRDYSPVIHGPNERVWSALSGVGHLVIEEQYLVDPMIRVDPEHVVPYLGFIPAQTLEISPHEIRANGFKVPLDRDQRVITNIAAREYYFGLKHQIISLRKTVQDIHDLSDGVAGIDEGDIVVLIPAAFTGRVDIKNTPLGETYGGFLLAAITNSVVTGRWVLPVDWYWLKITLISLFALFGASFAVYASSRFFWFYLVVGTLFATTGGILTFVYTDTILPWSFPSLSFLVTGIAVFAEKMRIAEKKTERLKMALSGVVSPEKLEEFADAPENLQLEPTGRLVTIMFIDIVSFSKVAESQSPQEAFAYLRVMLGHITQIIHKHGGVIDKTFGDGLLCFFGYTYDGRESKVNHADAALMCAIDIQRHNLDFNIEAGRAAKPIYPLRIGLNTAVVCIGNLGDTSRIDFTVIGHGVNFAKRLEEACDTHFVLISNSTFESLMHGRSQGNSMKRRLINMKHQKEPIEVFECDPLTDRRAERNEVVEMFRKQAGIMREETRWLMPDGIGVRVFTGYGEGLLVNFSQSGIAFTLPRYLAKGIETTFTIDASDVSLHKQLEEEGLTPIFGEIRWGRLYAEEKRGSDQFLHGALFKGLNERQRNRLNHILRHFLLKSQQGQKGVG